MINQFDVFLDKMKPILGEDYNAFVESLNKMSEKSILVNTNKISVDEFLRVSSFPCEQISYEKCGFYVRNDKLGRTPLHHAGAFYVQETSAMFTVNAYNFKGDEKVLDMCASPGGKTIQIANRIPNGVLVSNEISRSRAEILFSNVERMGIKNVVIANNSPEQIANAYGNVFDVCLVDAPCSGEGMFRKGDDFVKSWNVGLNEMCAKRQLEILEQANKTLKQDGHLIYSTCTYSIEENENVVNEFLKRHNYKLIRISSPSSFSRGIGLEEAVRLYPHQVRGEGQFVALMQKLEENELTEKRSLKLSFCTISKEFLTKFTDFDKNCEIFKNLYNFNGVSYFVKDCNLIKQGINYISLGVRLGETKKGLFTPAHYLFSAFGTDFKQKINFDLNNPLVSKYLKGESLDSNLCEGKIFNGYGAILVENCALGGFKMSANGFKNLYPKGLRNFKI